MSLTVLIPPTLICMKFPVMNMSKLLSKTANGGYPASHYLHPAVFFSLYLKMSCICHRLISTKTYVSQDTLWPCVYKNWFKASLNHWLACWHHGEGCQHSVLQMRWILSWHLILSCIGEYDGVFAPKMQTSWDDASEFECRHKVVAAA